MATLLALTAVMASVVVEDLRKARQYPEWLIEREMAEVTE